MGLFYGVLSDTSYLSWVYSLLFCISQSQSYLMLTSDQQPLRLSPAEVCEVIAAVCSEISSPNINVMTVSTGLNNSSGKPPMDVAVNVLIKLVIDMYVPMCLSQVTFSLSTTTTITLCAKS